MHSYAVESPERRSIPLYLAGASFGVAYALKHVAHLAGLTPSSYAYLPSGFVIYALLYVLFDRFAWRWRLLRVIGLVRIPYVGGDWNAQLRSSHSEMRKEHPAVLRIEQTWTSIRLTVDGARSFSASEMALIRSISESVHEVRWEYSAESKTPSTGSDFNHRGVTMLRFTVKEGVVRSPMEGHYYTQQGRETHGELEAERASDGRVAEGPV
jgi:hypothetical protein